MVGTMVVRMLALLLGEADTMLRIKPPNSQVLLMIICRRKEARLPSPR